MVRTFLKFAPVVVLTAGMAVVASTGTAAALSAGPSASSSAIPAATPAIASALAHGHGIKVCAAAAGADASCLAQVLAGADGKPVTNATTPSGYGPADLRSAYNLTASGAGTVAIVDAYDDPTAESDLGVYRSTYGLPACTTANGCFRKVNQSGGSKLPSRNGGWAQEISLDLDMVSAICPGCHILLVEASSTSFSNLGAGVNYAATQGVVAISNSYGGSDSAESSAYNHPGVAVVASTGDSGYGVQSPASFTHVVAVGGTSLTRSGTSRGWSESAWNGAGSGCSSVNARPSWQTSTTSCSGKANADVSAVADPNTGVAVYDSTAYQGYSGWMIFGGTSAASPIVAGVYALAGGVPSGTYAGALPWGHSTSLNDVTAGSNGTCSPTKWCTAGSGWDGPTGLGTPNGTGAF